MLLVFSCLSASCFLPLNELFLFQQPNSNTGIPWFIALHRCCDFFYKLKARPATSKKILTRFMKAL